MHTIAVIPFWKHFNSLRKNLLYERIIDKNKLNKNEILLNN
ncbi:hypothetical protein CSS_1035 [Campylobacter jejuni subsp. jejuni 305]|nr:hypothetical protein CSS_1035 [Campylobacter jejuni subsp. jejuni 305]